MSHKKKRNIIIGTLCGVLLLMVVGYAAFSSVLNIKGTSNIASNWNIKITSITSNVLHGTPSNAKDPEGVGTLEASFETNLVSPGDSMEYTITISNQGNINAKLDKITLSDPDNEYVAFETSGLTEGEELNKGATADLKVTVTFKDVEISKMEESTSNLKVTLDFSQANVDDSGIAIPSGPTVDVKGVEIPVQEEGSLKDGFYKDSIDEQMYGPTKRYIYKGSNPNNYITFNGELWRIVSLEASGVLQIIKKDSIGKMPWDTSNSNNWARPATLNTYLNNDYYNTLSSDAKNLIKEYTWPIGYTINNNNHLINQIYSETSKLTNNNIGLLSASQIIRANLDMEECGTLESHNYNSHYHNGTCRATNYIINSNKWIWTITYMKDTTSIVVVDGGNGGIGMAPPTDANLMEVFPTVFLKENITLSGSGTETDPYTIN